MLNTNTVYFSDGEAINSSDFHTHAADAAERFKHAAPNGDHDHTPLMTTLQVAEITQFARYINHVTLGIYSDYHEYLRAQAQHTDSLDEFLASHCRLIHFYPTATEQALDELATYLGTPLPQELRTFFKHIGGLHLEPMHIHSASSLLAYLEDPSDLAGIPTSAFPKSLGLVDMINLSCGNNRFELDPANGAVLQDEIDLLNARYTSLGWYRAAGDNEFDSATHIFFDHDGNFGTVFYHQDAFDTFWRSHMQPMLTESPQPKSLADILMDALRGAIPQTNNTAS